MPSGPSLVIPISSGFGDTNVFESKGPNMLPLTHEAHPVTKQVSMPQITGSDYDSQLAQVRNIWLAECLRCCSER